MGGVAPSPGERAHTGCRTHLHRGLRHDHERGAQVPTIHTKAFSERQGDVRGEAEHGGSVWRLAREMEAATCRGGKEKWHTGCRCAERRAEVLRRSRQDPHRVH